MERKIKTAILIVIFAILFLPMLEKGLSFIKSAPLNGEFTQAPDVEFNWDKWFDGSYWDMKSKYVNDNFGFRFDVLRLNDQIDFSLFRKIHSEWRLLGDNACVFQDMYVYSYLGRDYDGYPYILEKVRKLKAIQDTLKKLGKTLVFIQSPCKAFFYPEYIPQKYKDTVRGTTNYEMYKRIGDSVGLNEIDFNSWFVSMKSTSKELLYPKQGFHWSVYGSLLAADSLTKYLELQRNRRMVHPVWGSIVHTGKARDKDDDVAKSMNLIFPLTKEVYSYPVVKYKGDKTAVKPRVIFIGDSFLFHWMREGVLDAADSSWQIWFYNAYLVNNSHATDAYYPISGIDEAKEIDSADCIVIMFTSRNMNKMGNGFVEKTYEHFYPSE